MNQLEEIRKFAADHPEFTRKELEGIIGQGRTYIGNLLKFLCSSGFLEKMGEGHAKNVKYKWIGS